MQSEKLCSIDLARHRCTNLRVQFLPEFLDSLRNLKIRLFFYNTDIFRFQETLYSLREEVPGTIAMIHSKVVDVVFASLFFEIRISA